MRACPLFCIVESRNRVVGTHNHVPHTLVTHKQDDDKMPLGCRPMYKRLVRGPPQPFLCGAQPPTWPRIQPHKDKHDVRTFDALGCLPIFFFFFFFFFFREFRGVQTKFLFLRADRYGREDPFQNRPAHRATEEARGALARRYGGGDRTPRPAATHEGRAPTTTTATATTSPSGEGEVGDAHRRIDVRGEDKFTDSVAADRY